MRLNGERKGDNTGLIRCGGIQHPAATAACPELALSLPNWPSARFRDTRFRQMLSEKGYEISVIQAGTAMRFERGEVYLIILIAVVTLTSAILALVKGIDVDIAAFGFPVVFNLVFLAIGQFYRTKRADPRIASVVTAIGLMMISGHALKLLNYLLLPYHFHGTDAFLTQVDAWLGFVWADFVLRLAQYPAFCAVLKQVYLSCAWQIAGIILLLGLADKTEEIARFMLAVVIGGLVTIEVWSLFPSSTPAAFQAIPADVAARLGLIVSPEQGNWLVKLSYEGLKRISPNELVGIVGFPSYHTVLALLSVWFARKVRYLVIPIGILNALMLPAILLHGSHNLIDVFGGVCVTIVSVWFAGAICGGKKARGLPAAQAA
jgi:PAP2 superfamily